MWAARLVVLVAFFDLFMQFPTVAPYAEDFGASAALIGIIVAAYSFTNLFGNLGAGFVLDRWGRRGPVVIGLLITAVAVASYSLVQTSEQLIGVRAVHGIGAAILAPGAFAIIGDGAASDRRGHAMGVTGALIAVAALIGPPFAGILRDVWNAETVFLVDSVIVFVTLAVFVVTTREVPLATTVQTELGSRVQSQPYISERAGLWAAYAATFAITVGIGTLVTYLPLVLEAQGETAARSGYSFGIYALVAMVVMGSPISRASDRFGRFKPLVIGLVGVAAGLGVLGVVSGYGGVAIGMAVFGLGYGFVFPAAAALVTEATGAGRRGMAFGVFYAVYSFGVVVGSVGSGRLAEMQGNLEGVPFVVSAIIVLAVIPVVWMFKSAVVSENRQT
jgi:MFS family permease